MIIFYSFDVSKSEALTFIENKISLKSFTTQILNSFVKLSSMQMKTRRNNILDKQTLINCGTNVYFLLRLWNLCYFVKYLKNSIVSKNGPKCDVLKYDLNNLLLFL